MPEPMLVRILRPDTRIMRALLTFCMLITGGFVALAQQLTLPKNFSGVVLSQIGTRRETQSQLTDQAGKPIAHGAAPVFHVASLTKAFTAVLVLQQMEAGKLKLDAPVSKYLPDYAGPGRQATLRQLLTHSSGIANYEGSSGMKVYEQKLPLAEAVRLYASGPLDTMPGVRFSYNNGDYILLQQILERVTKKPFAALLQTRILAPLGLNNTVLDTGQTLPQLIPSYLVDSTGQRMAEPAFSYAAFFGAGALCSTPANIAAFVKGLFSGRLISRKSLAMMLEPNARLYGTGFSVWQSTQEGKRIVERWGSIQGSNALWAYDMATGNTLVILANSNGADLGALKTQWLKKF